MPKQTKYRDKKKKEDRHRSGKSFSVLDIEEATETKIRQKSKQPEPSHTTIHRTLTKQITVFRFSFLVAFFEMRFGTTSNVRFERQESRRRIPGWFYVWFVGCAVSRSVEL